MVKLKEYWSHPAKLSRTRWGCGPLPGATDIWAKSRSPGVAGCGKERVIVPAPGVETRDAVYGFGRTCLSPVSEKSPHLRVDCRANFNAQIVQISWLAVRVGATESTPVAQRVNPQGEGS